MIMPSCRGPWPWGSHTAALRDLQSRRLTLESHSRHQPSRGARSIIQAVLDLDEDPRKAAQRRPKTD